MKTKNINKSKKRLRHHNTDYGLADFFVKNSGDISTAESEWDRFQKILDTLKNFTKEKDIEIINDAKNKVKKAEDELIKKYNEYIATIKAVNSDLRKALIKM